LLRSDVRHYSPNHPRIPTAPLGFNKEFWLNEVTYAILFSMKRLGPLAVALAAIYFLLSFNAYACLLPLYSNVQAAQDTDCAMPKEQPVRDACDAFKTIGVQTSSAAQPLPDCHLQVVVGEQVSVPILVSALPQQYDFSGSPPFLDRDPLSLISILRI
jgi:hypothetical protein